MLKSIFCFIILCSYSCVGVGLAATGAGELSDSSDSNVLRRLGYIKGEFASFPVYLQEAATAYIIFVYLPKAQGDDDWKTFGAGAWLLKTNGASYAIANHPEQWAGPGIIDNQLVGLFQFQRAINEPPPTGIALRLGKNLYSLRVSPRLMILSPDAQSVFDELMNHSIEEIARFELDPSKKDPTNNFIRLEKSCLEQLGYSLTWDFRDKKYRIRGPR